MFSKLFFSFTLRLFYLKSGGGQLRILMEGCCKQRITEFRIEEVRGVLGIEN